MYPCHCSHIHNKITFDAGRPNNWVPLISAQTINDAIQPLLAALKTVEAIYVQGYLDRAKSTITKQEMQSYISQSVAATTEYDNQIATLQRQYDSTAATFAELMVQRTAAGRKLQSAGTAFQQEILSKLRLDAFLDGLQAIASIAIGSVPNLVQIGDIYSESCRECPVPLKQRQICLRYSHAYR